jgi:hypothetical protein
LTDRARFGTLRRPFGGPASWPLTKMLSERSSRRACVSFADSTGGRSGCTRLTRLVRVHGGGTSPDVGERAPRRWSAGRGCDVLRDLVDRAPRDREVVVVVGVERRRPLGQLHERLVAVGGRFATVGELNTHIRGHREREQPGILVADVEIEVPGFASGGAVLDGRLSGGLASKSWTTSTVIVAPSTSTSPR